jgi:hypothetical protein
MLSPVITQASVMVCPHGAPVVATSSQSDLVIEGAPALVVTDPAVVNGCPFVSNGTPSPCLSVTWTNPAVDLSVNGIPVLLQTSIGTCNGGSGVQGVVSIVSTETSVLAD